MSLFQYGEFTLAGGNESSFKIECDAMSEDDWDSLAAFIVPHLPAFGQVLFVPTGGAQFAQALKYHAIGEGGARAPWTLLVDDVYTTGKSINEVYDKIVYKDHVLGVVAFNRCPNPLPSWIVPIFTLNSAFTQREYTF